MTWVGSINTTITNSNVNGGTAIDLRAEEVTLIYGPMNQYSPVPGKSTSPNAYVDHIGVENRIWKIRGTIDMTDTTANILTIPLAGSLVRETGSHWFIDEGLAYINGTSESGVWVMINSPFKGIRARGYGQANYKVGHIIKYDLEVMETL